MDTIDWKQRKKEILLLLLLIFMVLSFILFLYKDDKDLCLDSGICAENLQINTEYGLITINEETCNKYNWKWNSQMNSCNIK